MDARHASDLSGWDVRLISEWSGIIPHRWYKGEEWVGVDIRVKA